LTPQNPPVDINDPGGLAGGHFDLDTSSAIYPFNGGVTDGHVHEWDDKNNLTMINYLDLADGNGNPLYEIDHAKIGIAKNAVFIVTVSNSKLSRGGRLEINSTTIGVSDYEREITKILRENNKPDVPAVPGVPGVPEVPGVPAVLDEFGNVLVPAVPPVPAVKAVKPKAAKVFNTPIPRYTLGAPTAAQKADGIQQLTSLKMSFDTFALVNGELLATNTGCVKDNKIGFKGEYRNGALLLQALDASDLTGGFVEDKTNQEITSPSTSIHSKLGYAKKGLLWESTVFWHWDPGECYGDDGYQAEFDKCFKGSLDCVAVTDEQKGKAKKTKKKGKSKKGEDPVIDPPADDGTGTVPSTDPGHNVSNTTVGGSNDMGRLFWKELIPEE
jgi:hypothetical protein